METLHITTAENTANVRSRVRSGLILLGIVTSLICSLILLKDIHSSERSENRLPTLIEASKVVATDLTVEVKNLRIFSAIWPLR